MIENKKSSILLVLKVLEEYTDEEHYLTQQEIIDKIYQNFNIELERKSVASSLKLLEELDYDIAKGSRGGFALLSRTFDNTEAYYLIDAILSSRSIDGKEAKRLSDAISSCFSIYQRKDYSYIYKSEEINRTSNKDVLLNVNIIHEAIKEGKMVGFKYITCDRNGNKINRKHGYEYIVSPYYLVNNFGRYYLICNFKEKYRSLHTFRIDYMIDVNIKKDMNIKRITELKDIEKNFSISKYINDHIYMFGGNVIDAVLKLDSEGMILTIKDWFGESIKILNKDDGIYVKIHSNEDALYYWVLQYSDCIKVVSPDSFVLRIKDGLSKAIEKYKD